MRKAPFGLPKPNRARAADVRRYTCRIRSGRWGFFGGGAVVGFGRVVCRVTIPLRWLHGMVTPDSHHPDGHALPCPSQAGLWQRQSGPCADPSNRHHPWPRRRQVAGAVWAADVHDGDGSAARVSAQTPASRSSASASRSFPWPWIVRDRRAGRGLSARRWCFEPKRPCRA